MLFYPRAEWDEIARESIRVDTLVRSYILPLSLIPPVATVIGMQTFDASWDPAAGYLVPPDEIYAAGLATLFGSISSIFLLAAIFRLIAPMYGSSRHYPSALKVATYGAVPVLVAGALLILPVMVMISIVALCHTLYLYWIGVRRVLDVPEEARTEFIGISLTMLGGLSSILGAAFTVTAVLPQTGTIDDSRAFAHLHTVQRLAGRDSALNAIEVVGCCNAISDGLVQKINKLLPDAKVVTISQIVDTQIKTNRMMSRLSLLFLVIIVLVGGASIANYMFANVFERRREIGTLMALGAGSGVVLRLFLLKALVLGLAGGLAGYVIGTIIAVVLGPRIAGVPVLPMPVLLLWAFGIGVAILLAASYFPARRAARMDPVSALQEV